MDRNDAYNTAVQVCEKKWQELEDQAKEYYEGINDYGWNILSPKEREYFTKGLIRGLSFKFSKKDMVDFAAEMVWLSKKEIKMECPNSVYQNIESKLEEWLKEKQ